MLFSQEVRRPLVGVLSFTLALGLLAAPASAALFGHHAAPTPPPPEPYAKFIAGAEKQPGLFTVYRKAGEVYLELHKNQLDTDYLEEIVPANGLGGFGFQSGQVFPGAPGGQEARIVRFAHAGKAIAMIWPDDRFLATPNTPLAHAVRGSTADSVEALLPVTAETKDAATIVVDLKPLLDDLLDIGNALSEQVKNPANPLGGYHLDPTRSYFGSTKAFPENVVVEANQTFNSSRPDKIDTVIDPRFIQFHVHYEFAQLPSDPGYMPRLADDRVGFWSDPHIQFGDPHRIDNRLEYITRWSIRPSDPSKPVSPAVKPIVFTISNTVPVEYRGAIRDAVLEWNKAFEKIGISGAVQIQDQPADPNFDPDDMRYNVIRWVTDAPSEFGAEAQPVWDPRTGQIFRAGILIDANEVRFGDFFLYENLIGPVDGSTAIVPIVPPAGAPFRQSELAYGRGEKEQFMFGAVALALMDGYPAGQPPPNFVHDFLKATVMHEVGHDFGLGHNFIGHQAYTFGELQSKSFTALHGIASSVMEYAPINLWPKGMPQGDYFQATLGPYDYHAIRWGYAPVPGAKTPQQEQPTLDRWAAEATQPQFRFAGDEDVAWDGHAVDPRVEQFMLSDHQIEWCRTRLGLAQSLIRTVDRRFPGTGQPWEIERYAFASLVGQYAGCATAMAHYVGGEYLSRARSGDPGAPPPLTAVPRADERRAFAVLDRYIFSADAWHFAPATLRRLVYTEYEPLLNFTYNPPARHDISISALAARYQNAALGYMFAPLVLQRIDDLPSKAEPGTTMSLADLFTWTQAGIVGDIVNGRPAADQVHRNLQRRYALLLAQMVVAPVAGTPYDARALARHELTALAAAVRRDLTRRDLDLQTRAHLEALATDAERALTAKVTIPA